MTTATERDAGLRLRALGWHQGALIPASEALAGDSSGRAHFIVASQDCDVVALTANEPSVDLLPAVVQSGADADLLYGKNPRRLCLPLADGQFATVDIRERVTVAKNIVASITPLAEASVAEKGRKLLAKWLGKRYARPAFPDAFNERLAAQKKRLDKLSKRDEGKLITTIDRTGSRARHRSPSTSGGAGPSSTSVGVLSNNSRHFELLRNTYKLLPRSVIASRPYC